MAGQPDSPRPISQELLKEGEAQAFIPYPPIGERLEHVPIYVRPDLHYYVHRMGFLPHTLKLYLHVPWMAQYLFRLNNAVMRDERNGISEHQKYRLSFIASRDNECRYCTAHTVLVLKRRWEYNEEELEKVLRLEDPIDEREAVAREFIHSASLDPASVTDDLRARLAAHFSPQEVMEIVLVLGFWKMYNTMHTVMGAPLEDPVQPFQDWVNKGLVETAARADPPAKRWHPSHHPATPSAEANGAFIPYAPVGEYLEHVPIYLRPELFYYISRMGFLPSTLRLYLHVPWAALYLFRLNNAVMRDERNALSEHFKYRLALLASRDNGCRYCTAHNVYTLKRRFQHSDEDLERLLHLEGPQDEREAVAMEFVHQGSLDPLGVTDDLRARLAAHFTPQEVMEIVLVVGFWKMYNTMHAAMAAPLEDQVLEFQDWVDIMPE